MKFYVFVVLVFGSQLVAHSPLGGGGPEPSKPVDIPSRSRTQTTPSSSHGSGSTSPYSDLVYDFPGSSSPVRSIGNWGTDSSGQQTSTESSRPRRTGCFLYSSR